MAVAIKLPDMGTNVEECKLLSWRVQEGQHVKRGDVLADIETDKAVAELESTAEGVLLRHVVKAGTMAQNGEILAYVGQAGEPLPDPAAAIPPASAANPAPAPAAAPSSPAPIAPAHVSPMVRNLAVKMGVDLASIRGTGAGGVITREDVLKAKTTPPSAPREDGDQPSRGQAAVARAVSKSWKETPHLYVSMSIDMTAALKARGDKNVKGVRPSFDAILLKALARAIAEFPLFAARWEGERVVKTPGIHIALAVGFGNDLFLPVIRDVNQKTLPSLQTEIDAVSASVRTGSLKPEQMAGGCMALSNLGMYPVEAFEGIIFPGHSSILTVGAVRETPVVVGGRVEVRPMLKATLGTDHRLINGRMAAEFLSKVKEVLESGNLG
jgi:pyruvate dehydrogenase E2 component (dihydrolipoamide acetyltransferase)